MVVSLFHALVVVHIAIGAIGLVSFWVPVLAKKGRDVHKRGGRLFARTMLVTGVIAVSISVTSLIEPRGTHPLVTDVALIRAQFGWLMMFLGVLTFGFAWHGLAAVRHRANHRQHRRPVSVVVPVLVIVTGVHCAYQGAFVVDQPLLVWVGLLGAFSASTILHFIFSDDHDPREWLHQHLRSSVGAGISAYTAFLAVMIVRVRPEEAFNPWLWILPTIPGSIYIGRHEGPLFAARFRDRRRRATAAAASTADSSTATTAVSTTTSTDAPP